MLNRRRLIQMLGAAAAVSEMPISAMTPNSSELHDGTLAHALVRFAARSMADKIATLELPAVSTVPLGQIVKPRDYVFDEFRPYGIGIVRFDKHMEATFQILDVMAVVQSPELFDQYSLPATIAITEAMREHAGANSLLMAVPPAIPVSVDGKPAPFVDVVETVTQRTRTRLQRFPIRVTMAYSGILQFTVQVFYGVSYGRKIPAPSEA